LRITSDLFGGILVSSLEKWAAIDRNGNVTAGGNEAVNIGEPGSLDIRDHDSAHFDKIWGDYEKEKKAMLYQKEEYERVRTEEIEARTKLAEKAEFIKSERARLRGEREARERLVQVLQEEREQRLLKQYELHQNDHELQARLHQGEGNGQSLPRHDADCPSRRIDIL